MDNEWIMTQINEDTEMVGIQLLLQIVDYGMHMERYIRHAKHINRQ